MKNSSLRSILAQLSLASRFALLTRGTPKLWLLWTGQVRRIRVPPFCYIAATNNYLGAEGESVPKIPTQINYDPNDKTKFSWGASVDRMSSNIVGVKLLLDPSQERPLYLPTGNAKRDLKKLPKTPVEIAADFIGAIYQHALTEIAKEVPESYMSICQKVFVLSGKEPIKNQDQEDPANTCFHSSSCGVV
jgi:hypothetical protein